MTHPMSSKTKALGEAVAHLGLPAPVCVEPATPLKEAFGLMKAQTSGCVLVCQGGRLLGVLTERDVLMRILGEVPLDAPVEKVMTRNPITMTPETTVGEAVEIMHQKGIRNLPLVDPKGRPTGLLTVRRVLKYLAAHFPAEVYNLPPKTDLVDHSAEGA